MYSRVQFCRLGDVEDGGLGCCGPYAPILGWAAGLLTRPISASDNTFHPEWSVGGPRTPSGVGYGPSAGCIRLKFKLRSGSRGFGDGVSALRGGKEGGAEPKMLSTSFMAFCIGVVCGRMLSGGSSFGGVGGGCNATNGFGFGGGGGGGSRLCGVGRGGGGGRVLRSC